MIKIELKDDYIDMRIDRFLKKYTKIEKNSEIFKIIKNGEIKINRKKTKENYRIKKEDKIIINSKIDLLIDRNYEAKNLKLDFGKIIYENDDFFIVDKNKNIPMHKGTNHNYGLSEYFKNYYNNRDINFANRLDYKTKGLVIGCKNQKALREITKLIRENKIEKKYIAFSKINDKDYVKIKEFEKKSKFEMIDFIDGKKSKLISYIKIIEKVDDKVKFEIELETGKKHQIRKQFQYLGIPIIGDDKYGNYKKEDELMLKCYFLKFKYNNFDYIFSIKY